MLPGKTYTPEDLLRIAWKGKWLILVPAVLIGAATVLYTRTLPDVYGAQATIQIVPQQVPEDYVQSAVTTDLGERLTALSQQILSRARLQALIEEFGLYSEEQETMIMEDIVDLVMRPDVNVQIAATRGRQAPGSFVVRYQSESPRVAQQVTQRLSAMFIDENLQDREGFAQQTNQFLETQLERARRQLVEHEGRLEVFRRQYAGQLPSQVESNLQIMQNAQLQLQTQVEAANRDQERLLILERQIADAQAGLDALALEGRTATDGTTAAQRLQAAREQLRAMEVRLRAEHPDVIRQQRVITELEAQAEAEALAMPLGGGEVAPPSAAAVAQQRRLSDLVAERQLVESRLVEYGQEQARLQAVIAQYRVRVEASPALETELTELMRDYETLQASYTSLLTRSQESSIAADLEQRQIGEQFRILNAATLPRQPIAPNRARLNLMGLLAGLGLGVGVVGLLEYRDRTLKTDTDVTVSLGLPVLATVPAMVTHAEAQQRRRRTTVASYAAAIVVVLGVAVAAAWRLGYLESLESLVR
jgi:polysaccharide chain length determinant protein (PEP-CTERM system associated)